MHLLSSHVFLLHYKHMVFIILNIAFQYFLKAHCPCFSLALIVFHVCGLPVYVLVKELCALVRIVILE